MKWALYYRCPVSQVMYPCYDTGSMNFNDPGTEPVLLARKENVEKPVRDYKRWKIEQAKTLKQPWLLASLNGTPLPGSETADHFVIVPIPIEPDFSGSYNYP